MEISIIPKFLDEAISPVAKEAGERLADIISLVFTPVIKARAKRDKNIELFLEELNKEVNNISGDKVKEPSLHIVAPVLEDIFKFYYNEDYLRKMFAKYIASSMNIEYEIHPSYSELIKQLTLFDIILIKEILLCNFNKTIRIYDEQLEKYITPNFLHSTKEFFYFITEDDIFNYWHRRQFAYEDGCEYRALYNHENSKFLKSLLNLKRLEFIDIKEQRVDMNNKPNRENKCEYYRYGSILVIPTEYLIDFMNSCCSDDLCKEIWNKSLFDKTIK